jgi:hypothetical protein
MVGDTLELRWIGTTRDGRSTCQCQDTSRNHSTNSHMRCGSRIKGMLSFKVTSLPLLFVEGMVNVSVNMEPMMHTVSNIESHNDVSVASALKIDIFPIVFSLANFSPLNAYRRCRELQHAMLNLFLR